MAIKRDRLHYTFRNIDGYQRTFNFVISEREAGKTTAMVLDKVYKAFVQDGSTSILIRRQIADITEVYIDDFLEVIRKFNDNAPNFEYKRKGLKEGIVDVYADGKRFLRIIALSNPMSRIKSLIIRDLRYIIFDEFICNQLMGEKYLAGEAFKFKELFNTFQRESSHLTCYFLGNPYSLYNPYFVDFDVDTKKIKRGTIYSNEKCVVECYEIKDELKKLILKRNPLYQFDDSYTRYAFAGEAINDANIKQGALQDNFKLQYIFRVEGKYIGIFEGTNLETLRFNYYVKFIDDISKRRNVYCFDFREMVERTILLSYDDKMKFTRLKIAFRNREITYESINCYYLFEQVFLNI